MKRRSKKDRLNELKELVKATPAVWSHTSLCAILDKAFEIGKGGK